MQGGEELSIEELFSNLSTYKEQLQQVRQLLVHDPGNSEYAVMEKELCEVTLMIVCFYIVLSCKITFFELFAFSHIMGFSPP